MAERVFVLDGKPIHDEFLSDLSQVMDHSYDIDEIYSLYGDWGRRGERFVDQFVGILFPADVNDSAEDFIALRNAMINLYCALDRATHGLDRRSIVHAAYSADDEALVITAT